MHARGGWAAGMAALGLAMGVAGGACSDEAGEDDEVRRSVDESVAVVELLTTSRGTIAALSTESSVTGTEALGMTEAIEMPVADRTEARRQTDEAIDRLVAAVEDHEDRSGPYAQALDALDGVAALREEADGLTGPPGFGNLDASEPLVDRYREIADAVEAATGELADSVDDPDLREGAGLYALGLEQSTLEGEAVRTVVLTVVVGGGLDDPEEVRTVADQLGRMTSGRSELEASASGPYSAPARDLLDQLDEAGLLANLEQVLQTSQVDISALLTSVEAPGGEGWNAFLDEVERIIADG